MQRLAFVPLLRPLFRGSKLGLEEAMGRALKDLEGELGYSLTVQQAVSSDAEAATVAQGLERASPDLLVLGLVTFVTGEVLAPLLALPFPKVLWAPQEAWEGGPLPQNALCGLNLALSLPYLQTPAKWAYGPPQAQELKRVLAPTLASLRGLKALREARVLRLGGPAPGFDAFSEAPSVGGEVVEAGLDELFAAYEAAGETQVREVLADWSELKALTPEAARALARLAVALEQVGQGFDGVALRDWPEIPDRLAVFPAASIAYLGDKGILVAPEGDVAGLLSQLLLRSLGAQDPILLDLVAASPHGVLLWHGGEAPRSWAKEGVRLLPHFNRGAPAVRDLVLREGPVTGVRVCGERIAVLAGASEGKGGYAGVSGWVGTLRWAGRPVDGMELLANWLNSRLPHHVALGRGNVEEALLEMRFWGGWEVVGLEPGGGVWGMSWQ